MIPKGAETVEMVDGRVYYSTDNWQAIWLIRPHYEVATKVRDRRKADLIRFLAVSQSSAGP